METVVEAVGPVILTFFGADVVPYVYLLRV